MLSQLPRFSKGQPARDAITAEFLNGLVDASRRSGAIDSSERNFGQGGTPATAMVKVHNTGGSTLEFGQVIRITGLAVPFGDDTDRFQFRLKPYFSCGTPAAETDQPLVIYRPIAAGEIGLACLSGIAVTRINVSDSAHLYAKPIASTLTHLASAEAGPVRILYKAAPDSGSTGWAVVLLGGGGGTTDTGEEIVADTCVRVMTWVQCNETGSLVRTFKWLMVPAAWVFDEPGEDCPTAEDE